MNIPCPRDSLRPEARSKRHSDIAPIPSTRLVSFTNRAQHRPQWKSSCSLLDDCPGGVTDPAATAVREPYIICKAWFPQRASSSSKTKAQDVSVPLPSAVSCRRVFWSTRGWRIYPAPSADRSSTAQHALLPGNCWGA